MANESLNPPTSPIFMGLPTELRQKIFKAALPISHRDHGMESHGKHQTMHALVALNRTCCREMVFVLNDYVASMPSELVQEMRILYGVWRTIRGLDGGGIGRSIESKCGLYEARRDPLYTVREWVILGRRLRLADEDVTEAQRLLANIS